MSSYLIDTHVLIWWLTDNIKLSRQHRTLIANPDNLILVSAVSIWEIVLKQSSGKLDAPQDLDLILQANNIEILDMTIEHALQIRLLPLLHSDPFDRMLIAQCMVEDLVFLTADQIIPKYDIKCL